MYCCQYNKLCGSRDECIGLDNEHIARALERKYEIKYDPVTDSFLVLSGCCFSTSVILLQHFRSESDVLDFTMDVKGVSQPCDWQSTAAKASLSTCHDVNGQP